MRRLPVLFSFFFFNMHLLYVHYCKEVENLSEERREEEKFSICRDSLFDSQLGEK